MEQTYYSISEITTMTGLSDRTIRNYRRRGLLQGELTGGKWCFSAEAVSRFLSEPFVQESLEAKRRAIVSDFTAETRRAAPALCAVADFPASTDSEALLLREQILALTAHYPVRMDYQYNPRHSLVRIILSGPRSRILPILEQLHPDP